MLIIFLDRGSEKIIYNFLRSLARPEVVWIFFIYFLFKTEQQITIYGGYMKKLGKQTIEFDNPPSIISTASIVYGILYFLFK